MKNEVTVTLTDQEYEFLKKADIQRPNIKSYTTEELIDELISRTNKDGTVEEELIKNDNSLWRSGTIEQGFSYPPQISCKRKQTGKFAYMYHSLYGWSTFTFTDERNVMVPEDEFKGVENDDTRTD